MANLFDLIKSVFEARTGDQRNDLALAHFQGVCDSFQKLQVQIPSEWMRTGASGATESQRAMVFYALASARMLLAEQLHVALIDDMKASRRSSQARLDLENLTGQMDMLTLAATMELTQANSTAGAWETEHHLREAVTPPPPSERGEDTVAHARAIYHGGLVMLSHLQEQLKAREQTPGADTLSTARLLLAEAQHAFDTLDPLASQLQTNPTLFAEPDSAMHEELERQVLQMVRLLEGAAAELAVPQVTQTSFWKNLVGDPRTMAMAVGTAPLVSEVRASGDRPWERDVWCMTSEVFKQTHSGEAHANRTLQRIWTWDPNPAASWALYRSVLELERQGAVRKTGACYNACPWTDIWHAEKTVRVGNKVVGEGREFCLHIDVEEDGSCSREVIVADFRPTDEIDYCDTDGPHHHED